MRLWREVGRVEGRVVVVVVVVGGGGLRKKWNWNVKAKKRPGNVDLEQVEKTKL
jgi:hypothetical protein